MLPRNQSEDDWHLFLKSDCIKFHMLQILCCKIESIHSKISWNNHTLYMDINSAVVCLHFFFSVWYRPGNKNITGDTSLDNEAKQRPEKESDVGRRRFAARESRKGEQPSEARGGSSPTGSLELSMLIGVHAYWHCRPVCLCVFIVHSVCLRAFCHAANLAQILLRELPMTDMSDKCAPQFAWHFKGCTYACCN